MGDSLREWAPSPDEERGALNRVWTGLRWKANQVPAEAVRSVELRYRQHQSESPFKLQGRSRRSLIVSAAVGTAIVWPRGVRVYAAGNDGLQVTLSDDWRVEMRVARRDDRGSCI